MGDFIKKQRWSIAFWSVQLLGWGGLVFIAYAFTPDLDGYKQTNIFYYGLISSFVIGMFTTGLLRAYLKRTITLETFDVSQLIKGLIAVAVTAFLYFGLSFGFGYIFGKYAEEHVKVPEMYKELGVGLLLINSFITIIGWTIFYMSVKIAAKLNANRLERSELNATLKQAQLNTLKGQINPHFMFNSLNNIRGLMLEDVERSREMLTKLSEMLRYSLTKNDVEAIALEEELDMVENYIALSKIQLEERLTYTEDVDPATLSLRIPPMTIQLLVENAVKHGISNLKSGGEVHLTTAVKDSLLCIHVMNTGKLQISPNSTQLGLKNIQQRLRLLYGDRASFSIKEEGNTVVAHIKIPLA
jgi:hypothetical protein